MSPGSFLLWGAQCGCFHTKDRPRGPYCEPHASKSAAAALFRAQTQKCVGRDLSFSGSLLVSESLSNHVLPFWLA